MQHGIDADHHGAYRSAGPVNLLPRGLAGNPAGGAGGTGGFAVECHRIFQKDKGEAGSDVVKKGSVQRIASGFRHMFRDSNAALPECGNALACDQRVWIAASHKHRADAGGENRLGAGRLLAGMTAGFQCHIE